ncbi:hypothetical protein HPB51_005385 [Rhipicephalus microplus]|uniref:Uncharacterized protein n=1 Tax=Rhipicephalus microplus TaxID=6941 RepID=A0A9J6DFS0_RHIMP|nr:hypothetical protein HPB51_005385 [Rhipicephalus microplus]
MTAPSKATHHHCVLQWNCRGLPNEVGPPGKAAVYVVTTYPQVASLREAFHPGTVNGLVCVTQSIVLNHLNMVKVLFRGMELGTCTPDPVVSACLSGHTPSQFAPEIVKAFRPAYNLAPPRFDCPCNLPAEVGASPSMSDIEGMQVPYTMVALQAAIDQAKVCKAPGPVGISYEMLKKHPACGGCIFDGGGNVVGPCAQIRVHV